MTQIPAKVVAKDHTDRTITIAMGSKRIEFMVGDRYGYFLARMPSWEENGWYNYLVSQLLYHSTALYINGRRAQKEEVKTMVDFRKMPSEEFSFTVIATEAKSVVYNGGRKWFKNAEDAKTFAGEVFEMEKNERKAVFDLAIVQCIDVVRPKPQIELISSFKKSSETNE